MNDNLFFPFFQYLNKSVCYDFCITGCSFIQLFLVDDKTNSQTLVIAVTTSVVLIAVTVGIVMLVIVQRKRKPQLSGSEETGN